MPGPPQSRPPPAVLLLGGLDPSGGAGLAADLSAVAALGCHGLPVASAWTVQDGHRVSGWQALPEADVRAQVMAAARAAPPAAVKTGMLAGAGPVAALADWLAGLAAPPPLVIDPVLAASDGTALVDAAGEALLCERLLPRAALVTPNAPEAARLTGLPVPGDERAAAAVAEALLELGPAAVVVTGGHLADEPVDVLCDGRETVRFPRSRLPEAHGTGCRFAAACAAGLARGLPVREAVARAGEHLADRLAGERLGRILPL